MKFLLIDTTISSTARLGITVAGGCNGNFSTNQTVLIVQSGIMLRLNNTLYVADNINQLYLFELGNRTGRVLRRFTSGASCLFYDNRTTYIYVTVMTAHLA